MYILLQSNCYWNSLLVYMAYELETALDQYTPVGIAIHIVSLIKDYDGLEQVCKANSGVQLFTQGTKRNTHN